MGNWIDEFYNNGNGIIRLNEFQKKLLERNAPRVLYQYRPIESYNVDNIKNRVIWARKATDFNDPYDCLITTSSMERQIKRIKRIGTNLLLKELEDMQKAFIDEAQKIRASQAVSCFSCICDSLLMWSHYADQHKGMCVVYDYKKLERFSRNLILPVSYGEKIDVFQKDIKGNYVPTDYAFIRKAKEWEYEQEWRIKTLLLNTSEKGITVETPLPEKIIFGSKTDFENPLVKDLINFSEKNLLNF